MFPNLFICGMQKAGTTWLHYLLKKNKKVSVSIKKEPTFFNQPSCFKNRELVQYLKSFNHTSKCKYILDSTPHYFNVPLANSHSTAEAIKSILGEKITFIVLIRNPIERAVSGFFHHHRADRVKPGGTIVNDLPDTLGIIDLGRFKNIYNYWTTVFDKESFYFYFYDDLKKSPKAFGKSILKDLGLKGSFLTCYDKEYNKKETNEKRLKGYTRVKISLECIEKLEKIYDEDIIFIETLFGRNFPEWRNLESIHKMINK